MRKPQPERYHGAQHDGAYHQTKYGLGTLLGSLLGSKFPASFPPVSQNLFCDHTGNYSVDDNYAIA